MLGNFMQDLESVGKEQAEAEKAIEKLLFTGEITPENIKGKVFLLRNKHQFINTDSDGLLTIDNLRGGSETYGGKQFALFYIGTDRGRNRHFFTMAQYDTGELLNVYPIDIANHKTGISIGAVRRDYKADATQYRLFYFEKVPHGAHSWRIKSMDGKCFNVANNNLTFENVENNDEQAWQLYHVRDFFVPEIQPLAGGKELLTPNWNKLTKPTEADAPELFIYQTIGSTILPYFVRQDPRKWQSLRNGVYYKLVRQQRWSYKGSLANNTSGDIDKQFSTSSGWSKEKSKSFYASVGVSLTSTTSVTVGDSMYGAEATQELSVSISAEMGWEESTSNTISEEKTESTTYHIQPHKKVYFWQPEERFILSKIDADGNETKEGDWTITTKVVVNTEVDNP